MKKLSVLLYPHNSLKQGTKPVTLDYIHTDEFRFRISQMFRIMYYNKGVGLAAPQVGWDARLFIGNPTGKPEHTSQSFVLINPEIIPLEGRVIADEGCLSLPGLWMPVERHDKINVKALNEKGFEFELEAHGFLSRIIQHENDHLYGVMMMDRLEGDALKSANIELTGHVKRVKDIRRRRENKRRKREAELKKKMKARAKAKAKRKRKR